MKEAHVANSLPPWSLDQIPYHEIDLKQVADREDLFYLVAAASFVEIAADLYTSNLISYFEDDKEIVDWLEHHWQHEEVRHGHALRGYVRHVWPQFDWERAYAEFYDEYSRLCLVEEFEPTRCLEMVARCVVETGTATFYQALSQQTNEPVLKGIALRIRADEISHYKYFYKYFRAYSERESPGRWRIMGALKRRVLEARNSDADCALWHVYTVHQGSASPDKKAFKVLCKNLGTQVRNHYPVSMAIKMFLKPLHLPAPLLRFLQGPLAHASVWLLR